MAVNWTWEVWLAHASSLQASSTRPPQVPVYTARVVLNQSAGSQVETVTIPALWAWRRYQRSPWPWGGGLIPPQVYAGPSVVAAVLSKEYWPGPMSGALAQA